MAPPCVASPRQTPTYCKSGSPVVGSLCLTLAACFPILRDLQALGWKVAGVGNVCSPRERPGLSCFGQMPLRQSRVRYTAEAGITALRGETLEAHKSSI